MTIRGSVLNFGKFYWESNQSGIDGEIFGLYKFASLEIAASHTFYYSEQVSVR